MWIGVNSNGLKNKREYQWTEMLFDGRSLEAVPSFSLLDTKHINDTATDGRNCGIMRVENLLTSFEPNCGTNLPYLCEKLLSRLK